MSFKNILLEKKGTTAIVTMNRPDKLNALNHETLSELEQVFTELKNDKNVFVVIITGSGQKAFIAGADISELNKLDILSAKSFAERGQRIFNLIENLDKPVIAAVNGFALGGGCELALACHIRLVSENAKFGQPEVNLGVIPGFGGTQRLTRLINSGRAMEYILTGDMIDANEALRIGLANRIYKQEELLQKAEELAGKISSKAQQAIRLSVKSVNIVDEVSSKEGMNYEASLFAVSCGTEDAKEGTAAFLEKRKPNFTHK